MTREREREREREEEEEKEDPVMHSLDRKKPGAKKLFVHTSYE